MTFSEWLEWWLRWGHAQDELRKAIRYALEYQEVFYVDGMTVRSRMVKRNLFPWV